MEKPAVRKKTPQKLAPLSKNNYQKSQIKNACRKCCIYEVFVLYLALDLEKCFVLKSARCVDSVVHRCPVVQKVDTVDCIYLWTLALKTCFQMRSNVRVSGVKLWSFPAQMWNLRDANVTYVNNTFLCLLSCVQFISLLPLWVGIGQF